MKRIFLAIFLMTAAVWFLLFAKTPERFLETDFLAVGQGDAILVKIPQNRTMLIDGGPGGAVLGKLGRYLPPLAKRIDVVVLTHPHSDHASGLVEVLKRYEIGIVVASGAEIKTDIYSEFLKTIKEKNIPVVVAESGTGIHFNENLELDILSPKKELSGSVFNKNSEGFGASGNDVNDASIVGKLIFNDFSILFTGDATSKIENQLLIYGDNLKSDILKAGHHGSKYSSSLRFLKLVSPKAAMIEVGAKNRYGHPAEPALSRLAAVGAEIFRTDLNGDIKILTDGFMANIYKEK